MSLTKSQKLALEWLRNHGGDGVRVGPKGQQILAQGDIAPFFYNTFFQTDDDGVDREIRRETTSADASAPHLSEGTDAMTEPLCPICGSYSRRNCGFAEMSGLPEDEVECPWEEPDPDRLREDRDERNRLEREPRP